MLQTEDFQPLHDDENSENVALAAASWVTLMQESPVDGQKPFRRGKRFLDALMSDYVGTVRAYKALGNKLLRSIHAKVAGERITLYLDPLHDHFKATPLFREYQYFYKYRDTGVLKYLMTFLWWARKAEYSDPALEAESLAAWKRHEELMQSLEFTRSAFVLADLKMILKKSGFYKSFSPSNLVFKHGPGTVAEGSFTQSKQKHALMIAHPDIQWIIDQVPARAHTPRNRTLIGPLPHGTERASELDLPSPYRELLVPDELEWDTALRRAVFSLNVDELLFVTKDVDSKRVINRGPTVFQWAQQAVHNALVKAIDGCLLGQWIKLADQGHNQRGARLAARTLRYSTIDLSKASDSIHTDVVTGVFSGLPLDLLIKSRVNLVKLPDGETWSIAKFAPMGSAVCFDVQSIIFLLIVWLADHLSASGVTVQQYLSEGKRRVLNRTALRLLDPAVGVYGDDILCAREQTEHVMSLLRHLGLEVNAGKSFYGDLAVAESCGEFALINEETQEVESFTPILFKVKGMLDQENSQRSILSKIDLCNRLYDHGYLRVRNLILRTIPPKYFVYVDPETSPYWRYPWAVKGNEPNYAKRRKRVLLPGEKRENLQRTEMLICRPILTKGEDPDERHRKSVEGFDNPRNLWNFEERKRNLAEERYRLGLWYARPFLSEGPDHDPLDELASMQWQWGWTPVA